jgi:type IV secretory pathway VirB4 component
MAHLLYYVEERMQFKDEFSDELGYDWTTLFFERLKQHYKFRQQLVFGGRRGGTCNGCVVRIKPDCLNLGVLVHEVAHAIQMKSKKPGQKWHTKKHTRLMIKVFDYVKAHRTEWITNDKVKTERRQEAHQERELRASNRIAYQKTPEYKLEVLRNREKHLLSRSKRLNTSLKKVQSKIKRYEKKITYSEPVPNHQS